MMEEGKKRKSVVEVQHDEKGSEGRNKDVD